VPHTVEAAKSGRARCRGCNQPIGKGELRLGERLPNPFAEGEMTLWFHPLCAAYKRPQALIDALEGDVPPIEGLAALVAAARKSLGHRRLPRIDGAERAARAQARCRSCREPIERDTWRVRLVYFEEGRFAKSGFIHLDCRQAYFETDDVADAILHFSPDLAPADRDDLVRALG
jgi:poly [ADP-ribose] polymerase